MADYYYFCSQLPSLQPGGAPPYTLAAFDALVGGLLPQRDAAYITSCYFEPDRVAPLPDDSVGAAYRDWEFALRGEVARLRAAASGEAAPVLPPETDTFAEIRDLVNSAASAPNPLERERRLDALRFAKLNDLESRHAFSKEMVACYRIKLSILIRNRQFLEAAGKTNFEDAVTRIDRNSAE